MIEMDKKDEKIELPPSNGIFSFSIRFNIMLLLYVHKKISFIELQKLLNLTSGNLNHHLTKLTEEDYIQNKKIIFSTKPMNMIFITEKGKQDFKSYLSNFKDILSKIEQKR